MTDDEIDAWIASGKPSPRPAPTRWQSANDMHRACPVCKAQAGDPCRRPNGDRLRDVYGTPLVHKSRRTW